MTRPTATSEHKGNSIGTQEKALKARGRRGSLGLSTPKTELPALIPGLFITGSYVLSGNRTGAESGCGCQEIPPGTLLGKR